jgi:calcineurin-like phosphoesterase family protein
MGDAAFDDLALETFALLPGRKILIKGNHDDLVSTDAQANVFEEIHGMLKYKSMWLTHCPMHPDELRGKPNVHAHVHQKSIMRRSWYGKRVLDKRYLNTCVDALFESHKTLMIDLDSVKSYFGK